MAWLLWLDPGACQAGWEDICKGLSIGVTLTMNIGLSQTAQASHLALRQEDREGRQGLQIFPSSKGELGGGGLAVTHSFHCLHIQVIFPRFPVPSPCSHLPLTIFASQGGKASFGLKGEKKIKSWLKANLARNALVRVALSSFHQPHAHPLTLAAKELRFLPFKGRGPLKGTGWARARQR